MQERREFLVNVFKLMLNHRWCYEFVLEKVNLKKVPGFEEVLNSAKEAKDVEFLFMARNCCEMKPEEVDITSLKGASPIDRFYIGLTSGEMKS